MCSKLYADGELAATPYETDKVLRHRELCMGLNVLYAKKNHDAKNRRGGCPFSQTS